MITKQYRKGESVFRAGDKSVSVCLLLSGEIGLYFPTDERDPYMHIKEYETFGEMGLIESELRNARAMCLTDCEVLHIEKTDFEERIHNADPLLKALVRTLSARLRDANRKLSLRHQVA